MYGAFPVIRSSLISSHFPACSSAWRTGANEWNCGKAPQIWMKLHQYLQHSLIFTGELISVVMSFCKTYHARLGREFIHLKKKKSDLDSNKSNSQFNLTYLGLQGSLSCFQFSHSFSDIHIRSSILLHLANKLPLKQRGGFKQAHRKPLTRLQQRFNPRLAMLSKQSANFSIIIFFKKKHKLGLISEPHPAHRCLQQHTETWQRAQTWLPASVSR